MALQQASQTRQIVFDDVTGQSFLATIATDGTITSIVSVTGTIDAASQSQSSITDGHQHIHEGESYTCHFTNTVTNINEQTVIAFTTPDTTKWLHMVAVATASAVASFFIAEVTSIDVDEGTQLAVYNRDRNSSNTSGMLSIETTPIVNKATSFNEAQATDASITTTTQIHHEDIGTTGHPISTSGGASRGLAEFLLKQNTEYAVILNAEDNNTNVHNIILSWYEHTNVA